MNRLTVSILALGLAAAVGTASAQSGYDQSDGYYSQAGQPSPDRYGQSNGAYYDYARVVRVDPVIQSGITQSGYYGTSNNGTQRCYERPGSYAGNDQYNRDGYYGNNGGYGNDPYYPQQQDGYGTSTGRTIATVLGGVLGAAIGSQVGGGSARYATSAIGTMVGGIAGRQVYESTQRNRARTGTVTVCDPEPVRDGYDNYPANDSRVTAYDVTYEYGGRSHVTRTNYHPGDRIRVRVDVRPE